MLIFGIGAALPLLIIELLSREALQRWRKQVLSVSHAIKAALGVLLILIGVLVLAGFDKHLETVLVNASPQWLTDLTNAVLGQAPPCTFHEQCDPQFGRDRAVVGRGAKSSSRIAARTAGAHCREQ
jgi:hypothetical protein